MRRGGLAKLTRSCFDLCEDEPAVILKAGAQNKYKNERRVPLKVDTAVLLKQHLETKMPQAPAFNVPPREHSAKMVKADLDEARAKWLDTATTPTDREEWEKTDFLLYCDSQGRFLDFHALRHTRGVWLFEHHKAHPREVQELMGAGSMALVDRYTRSFRLTDLSVIARGPDLTIPVGADESMRKTGTSDLSMESENHLSPDLSPDLSPSGGFPSSSVKLGEVNEANVANAIDRTSRAKTSRKDRFLTHIGPSSTIAGESGGVAEWPNAPVLKTGGPARVP